MSSTQRVKVYRQRKAEQGYREFRMRIMRHEWEEMEQVYTAVHSLRGAPEPARGPTNTWRMWLSPEEWEIAQAIRNSIMARRSQ